MTTAPGLAKLLSTLVLAFLTTAAAAQTSVAVNADGWTSVWVQRGTSPYWDAVWTRGNDQVTTVMEGSIRGRDIVMRRVSSSDGALCEYRGTIGADGRSAAGTRACPGTSSEAWVGQLQGRVAAGPGPANPAARDGAISVNADGWTSTWIPRGRSGLWDAVWVQGNSRVTTVMQGSVQGDQISLRRVSSSDGSMCEYRGNVGADGRSVSGTQYCPGHSDVAWVGQFGSDGGYSPPAPPSATARGQRYLVENLGFSQAERGGGQAQRDFVVDPARCTVRELNSATDQGRQQVRVSLCQPNRRIAFATVVNGQVLAEYDWLFSDDGRSATGAWREGRGFGPSVAAPGQDEGRKGFR